MIQTPVRPIRSHCLSLALGTVVTAAFLSACNRSQVPTAGALKVLSYGSVSSPIYDALNAQMNVTVSNGTQKPGDYDLVVIDGDAFSGQQLKEDALIRQAIESHTWVLGLDMNEEDKRNGLGDMMGASTPDGSKAYLVRRTRVASSFRYNIMDLNDSMVAATDDAQHIAEKINAARLQTQDVVPAAVPSGLLHTSYEVTQGKYNPKITGTHNEVISRATQNTSWEVITDIDLYLDNDPAYKNQGPQQWAVVQVQGSANPNQLLSNNYEDDNPREVAWYQTQFSAAVNTPSGFEVVDTQPKNVNGSQNVTTGSTFSIGGSAGVANGKPTAGVTASYTYSNSVTRTITDWQVQNDSNSNSALYRFASNNPTNGLITSAPDPTSIYGDGQPREPNNLSLNNLQYQTLTTFKTPRGTVTKGALTFTGEDQAWYSDVSNLITRICGPSYDGGYACVDERNPIIERHNNHQPWTINVNMGQVYPVALSGLTVNGNAEGEVTAGQRHVPVVLTLKDPAPGELVVPLSLSNTNNFTFDGQPEVTIHKGDTSGTFYINVAENSQGKNSNLAASYTTDASAIVSVRK